MRYEGVFEPISKSMVFGSLLTVAFMPPVGACDLPCRCVRHTLSVSRHWISCHMEMFECFGGVTAATVPDNKKTGVTNPCRYEPDLNPTYAEFACHYDTAILATRTKKPRDKAKVENGVLNAQRRILAKLRNHTFFSVNQANEAIAEELEAFNSQKYQRLDVSRRELFETLDRPALRPLPARRYQYGEWSKPKVNIDYHVEVEKHYYSASFQLVGERVAARRTSTTVEVFSFVPSGLAWYFYFDTFGKCRFVRVINKKMVSIPLQIDQKIEFVHNTTY